MAGIKTDNAFLFDKIKLRANHLPEAPVVVLDAFGGHGLVWAGVGRATGRTIKRLAVDNRNDLSTFHLHGDNVKILAGMDLSKFNVIDLDAYGVPYDQLKIVFQKKFHGTVFVTFIQTMNGVVPHGLLCDVGFSKTMIEKTPSLFFRRGWTYFKEWLALNGVREVWHRSHARKHYLAFNCAALP